jgi:hypothetical protein
MRPSPLHVLPVAAALALLLHAPAAGAYERQWQAGGTVGYAMLAESGSEHGVGLGLHLRYGLSDAFDAMLEMGGSYHPSSERLVAHGAAGVAYVFDVLQWVPYAGLTLGGYYLRAPSPPCMAGPSTSCEGAWLGASIPFGLDYRITRSFAVGAQGRYHLLFLGPSEAPLHYVTALARAEYIWGF